MTVRVRTSDAAPAGRVTYVRVTNCVPEPPGSTETVLFVPPVPESGDIVVTWLLLVTSGSDSGSPTDGTRLPLLTFGSPPAAAAKFVLRPLLSVSHGRARSCSIV
jgi:hypothetical protein